MKYRFLSIRGIVLFVIIAGFLQTGCRENVLINSKLSPSTDSMGVYSTTLSCITHTVMNDSGLTSTNIGLPIYQAVGTITDPFFGSMYGATYFQVIPTTITSHLYDSSTIDSAFLILPYGGFTYGDSANSTLTQSYQVFYMLNPISLSTNYYNYTTSALDQEHPLSASSAVNIKKMKDSSATTVTIKSNYPSARIPLNLSILKNRLLSAQASLDSSSPIAAFINAFNGVCIKPTNANQSNSVLPYYRLDGTDTFSEAGILVYYHPNKAPTSVYIEPYYFSSSSCAHFNNISKNYAHFPVGNLYKSTQINDSIVALQNSPGPGIDVLIPGISKLPKGIINKVELQLTLLPGYTSTNLFAPEKLYSLGISNANYPTGLGAGISYLIADQYPTTSLTPLQVLDGYEHLFNSIYRTFTLDFPREMMASIAAGNDTLHLRINGTTDYYGAFHLVAGGGNYPDSNYRSKVKIVYSKLNK